MTSGCFPALAVSSAVLPSYRRESGREVKVEAAAVEGEGGGCGWRGEAARRRPAAGPLRPKPHPAPRPKPPNAPHPRPSVPRLTPSLRLASAPAMSSASTQGARPLEAARCNAVLFCCGGAAAGHTHAVGAAAAGGQVVSEGGGRGAEGAGGRLAGRRSRCLWPQGWHPW